MFTVVIIAAAVAVAARLMVVVRNDRPVSPPRSHTHELDPHSARLYRVD
jgi:hypothetical protein